MESPHTIPPHAFVAEFLPYEHTVQATGNKPAGTGSARAPPLFSEHLEEVAAQLNEVGMHNAFAAAVNASGVAPNYRVSRTKDEGINVSGLYPRGKAPTSFSPNWEFLDLPIYCFKHGEDPFQHDGPAGLAKENLGEIVSHTARLLARQHRTHVFTVVIVGKLVRFMRITRSVVIVTNSVSHSDNADLVADFFQRYSHLSPPQRGFDTTACLIPKGSEMHLTMLSAAARRLDGAADHARRNFALTLNPFWPCWKLAVDDSVTSRTQHFLVAQPWFHLEHLDDRRGSRGYIALALDQPGQPFVFLKDTWRWEQHDLQPEGATLRRLNAAHVSHIPTLVCEGVVPDQRLDFKDLLGRAYGRPLDSLSAPISNVVLLHYRVVVQEVGMPVREFKNGRQLVKVFCDYIEAHRDAFLLANTLHRDISAGNMLMVPVDTPSGEAYRGILMDWELSEHIKPGVPRNPTARRGTYQYLSVKAMDHPQELIQVADELEAFIHVLIKLGIRYLPHDCVDAAALHDAYFDTSSAAGPAAPQECSSLKRYCVAEGGLFTSEAKEVVFVLPEPEGPSRCGLDAGGARTMRGPREHPFQKIIDRLLEFASSRHETLAQQRERDEADSMQGVEEERPIDSPPNAQYWTLTDSDATKENKGAGSEPPPPRAKPVWARSAQRENRVPFGDATTNRMPPLLCGGPPAVQPDVLLGFTSEALDTHLPFISVLSAALRRSHWPREDKTADQLRDINSEEADGTFEPSRRTSTQTSDGSSEESDSESSEAHSSSAGDKSDCSEHKSASGGSEKGASEEAASKDDSEEATDEGRRDEEATGTGSELITPPESRPSKRARDDDNTSKLSSSDLPLTKRTREL
ncbi:hypothetical protein BC628DRAFT_128527 [Trametes gibbosa]|nr:hypothetical protein BC628DRAFT_128527 [Trametes gibbosa]